MKDIEATQRKSPNYFVWTQKDELIFLRRIGTHGVGTPRHVAQVSPWQRRVLLLGYIRSLEKPRRWFTGADVEELRATAEQLLDEAYVGFTN